MTDAWIYPDPDRITGFLLGGAIGDALGAPIEGLSMAAIQREYGEAGLREYAGSGKITANTQLTLMTLDAVVSASIRERARGIGGALTGLVQESYLRWSKSQVEDDLPIDDDWLSGQPSMRARRTPSPSCLSALRAAAGGKPGVPLGTVDAPINDSKGNGAVTRVAPVAFVTREAVFAMGCAVAALTHGHPGGYLPGGVLATMVWELLRGAEVADAMMSAQDDLQRHAGYEETSRALDDALTMEDLESLGGGWTGPDALAIGVHAALNCDDEAEVPDALLSSVNHSGDSDSTGAVCGTLLGARFGARSLPGHWQSGLEVRRLIVQLAADAALEFGPNPPKDPAGWDAVPTDWHQRHEVKSETNSRVDGLGS